MSELTTEDVRRIVETSCDRLRRDITDTLNSAILPVIERTDGHHRTLYGQDGRNGLVNDVALLQDSDERRDDGEKAIKGWLATALLSALGALASALWVLIFGRHP